jgi:hypothetical protein
LVGATLVLCHTASAQIQFRLAGGADTNLPSDRIINVGTLTAPTLLHIFDATGADESITGPEADMNNDSNIDPDDLSDYIAAYFSRCL